MTTLRLPISKSLLSRHLILRAVHKWRKPKLDDDDCCNDVRVIQRALVAINSTTDPCTVDLEDNGTALRFITAYAATRVNQPVTITGTPRLCQRPIYGLIRILESLGAQVTFLGSHGFAPFTITSPAGLTIPEDKIEVPTSETTQFASALILIGANVRVKPSSPYISMTRALAREYRKPPTQHPNYIKQRLRESDWSAAAFWYEYVAIYGGELILETFYPNSLQGDSKVQKIFEPLGVVSTFDLKHHRLHLRQGPRHVYGPNQAHYVDFSNCPDLYPPVAVTCQVLGVPFHPLGIHRLVHKESNRIESVQEMLATGGNDIVRSYNDHRIAMAALVAGWLVDNTDCIAKSYPRFLDHLLQVHGGATVIIPRRGINDDNLGKKHALHKLISAARTEYVWLRDDDVIAPPELPTASSDLLILPLRMDGGNTLIERLQRAEYAAIQEVTMRTAKAGRAVMCSGANLIVRRDRWLESFPDLHSEIPSGDDMFLLESFRRRGLTIDVADDPQYTATVHPLTSLRDLLRQRMRWAGKAPHYTDPYIRRYGARILSLNILQLLCPLVLLFKFPYEYSLIKKRDHQVSLIDALLLEILYPFYMLIVLLGGLLSQRRW